MFIGDLPPSQTVTETAASSGTTTYFGPPATIEQPSSGVPTWVWVVGALLVLALIYALWSKHASSQD